MLHVQHQIHKIVFSDVIRWSMVLLIHLLLIYVRLNHVLYFTLLHKAPLFYVPYK